MTMAKFGICTGPDKAPAAKAAGWDYIEGNVQSMFSGGTPDAAWGVRDADRDSALPIPAANCLLPGDLKVTGPDVDAAKVDAYMANALARAGRQGTKTLVFGSGGARNVPEGFDRARAKEQIVAFLKAAMPHAQKAGVTIVAEPLNRGECNIINSVGEAMEYVRAVDHPNFQCLVDSYHFWLEREPLSNLEAAMPFIKHVHIADEQGRVAPGVSGNSDYRPFFRVLKNGGYDGNISIECKVTPEQYESVLAYIKREWAEA
ncbi:MAG: sugar phosphate isomerase/epimerase [Sphingomonas sp.]|nr:MAG: sugar phosphate isomerase/epimerase [Sphingomonas sp.]